MYSPTPSIIPKEHLNMSKGFPCSSEKIGRFGDNSTASNFETHMFAVIPLNLILVP